MAVAKVVSLGSLSFLIFQLLTFSFLTLHFLCETLCSLWLSPRGLI